MTVERLTTVKETIWGEGRAIPGEERSFARAFITLVNGKPQAIQLKIYDGKQWLALTLSEPSRQPLLAVLRQMHRSIGALLEELDELRGPSPGAGASAVGL